MSKHTNSRAGKTGTGARGLVTGSNATASRPGAAFGLRSLQCPDCGATTVGQQLAHAASCPLNRAINRVIDGDRDWFEAHPGEDVRRRPVTPAEVADAAASDLSRPVGTVTVRQLAPGLRSRQFEYGAR